MALEARQEAEQALQAATATLAETLHTLLAEDVPAERGAAPLELDTVEVQAADEDDPPASRHRRTGMQRRHSVLFPVLRQQPGGHTEQQAGHQRGDEDDRRAQVPNSREVETESLRWGLPGPWSAGSTSSSRSC